MIRQKTASCFCRQGRPANTRVALVTALVVSGAAFAQQKEIRQAKAGDSCRVSFNGCGEWCDKNKASISDRIDCKQSCSTYHSICTKTGTCSTPLGKVEIRGLSAE